MDIILLEKVRNLGGLGDQVKVRSGYGRNFLIPQGKAVPANKANVEHFEQRRTELEQAAAEKLSAAQARADQLANVSVTITAKSGDEGKLFGSIGTNDIASAISEAGVHVEKSEVLMPNGAIRAIGDYDIDVQLHTDVQAVVSLTVVSE